METAHREPSASSFRHPDSLFDDDDRIHAGVAVKTDVVVVTRTTLCIDRDCQSGIVAAARCTGKRRSGKEINKERPIRARKNPAYAVARTNAHAIARAATIRQCGAAIVVGPHLDRVVATVVTALSQHCREGRSRVMLP